MESLKSINDDGRFVEGILNNIETNNHIKIILALEIGSIAYGLPAERLNIAFVYTHNKGYKPKISFPKNNNVIFQCWSNDRFIELLAFKNCSVITAMFSSVVYRGIEFHNEIIQHINVRSYKLVKYYHALALHKYNTYMEEPAKNSASKIFAYTTSLILKWIHIYDPNYRSLSLTKYKDIYDKILPLQEFTNVKAYNVVDVLLNCESDSTKIINKLLTEPKIRNEHELWASIVKNNKK